MSTPPAGPTWLGPAGLVAAGWAALPPYSGPSLEAARGAEVVDHVVPAGVLLLASVATLALRRRPGAAPAVLGCGLLVALAGLWMTATHLPLVRQATGGGVPWDAVAYHSLPGLVVLALGLVWTARSWSAAAPAGAGVTPG
jgi:hypothetical protein